MKNRNIKKLLEIIEGERTISDKFHSSTTNKKLGASNTIDVPQSWIKIHFKTYPRFDKIQLDNIEVQRTKLREIIKKRRSARNFSSLPISRTDLFHLLFLSCGITSFDKKLNDSRRPYPSAGARYPLEVYPIVLNCEGISKGLYHYNVKENCLELLLEKNLSNSITKITGGEKWIDKAAIVFVITTVLDRTRIKYADRGYRYILIETGHLAQNICLLATEMDLGSCCMGGFIDDKVNKLLDINLQKEVALYLIAVGRLSKKPNR